MLPDYCKLSSRVAEISLMGFMGAANVSLEPRMTDAARSPKYGNAQKADFAKFGERPRADFGGGSVAAARLPQSRRSGTSAKLTFRQHDQQFFYLVDPKFSGCTEG